MRRSHNPLDLLRQPEFITIDEAGDLWLIVGTGWDSITLLVDSRTLCRASKVFRSMLRAGFMESKPQDQGHWEVKLPDDKSLPFIILMDIIHCEFERTPVHISLYNLHDVCILANKYDMTKVLRPMAATWYRDLEIPRKDSLQISELCSRLFVFWELGCWKSVQEMLPAFAQESHINPDGELVYMGSSILDNLQTFRLLPLIDCLNRALPDDIIDNFVQATHHLGIASFFLSVSNAEETEYRGNITRLNLTFSLLQSSVFGKGRRLSQCPLCGGSDPLKGLVWLHRDLVQPLPQRHMEILREQAAKTGMANHVGSAMTGFLNILEKRVVLEKDDRDPFALE
ncbi:hypothetical protein FAVG1_01577 [Fusarium avenaceum]|nr:hypothetical protein FAVG1_01577 [Fusarium avenaceum]